MYTNGNPQSEFQSPPVYYANESMKSNFPTPNYSILQSDAYIPLTNHSVPMIDSQQMYHQQMAYQQQLHYQQLMMNQQSMLMRAPPTAQPSNNQNNNTTIISIERPVNHCCHCVLCFCTAGLWLPCWLCACCTGSPAC